MDNKKLGIILVVVSVLFLVSLIVFKLQTDNLADILMEQSGGTCFLENGTCIHEQSQIPVYISIIAIGVSLSLGVYLLFFDKSQKYEKKNHEKIVERLEETKKEKDKDENFEFLLKAMNKDEQKIMKAVKEQDGITQSTLRIRIDMSKAKLSIVLTELEEKNLIKKVPYKKN
jgi:uncharacterized membrane protein